MNQPSVETLTLFDLIARQWQVPGAVADLAFSADGASLAAATADGGLAIAAVADAEPPESRIRVSGDLGQTMIRPRTGQPVPLVALGGLADQAPPLVAAASGFLVGAGDGRVLEVAADGSTRPTAVALDGAVAALDRCAATGMIAAADAAQLALGSGSRLPLAGAARLAFAPGGGHLAVALEDRTVLVDPAGDMADLALPAAGLIRWRPDGTGFAAALGRAGLGLADAGSGSVAVLGGFPAAVGSLAWCAGGAALAVAGAFRIAAWEATLLPGAEPRPLVCGRAGLVLVETVAAHPRRRLVAGGLANGQVLIAEIGGRDELLLRQQGAAVTALAFSPDGRHLAIGDAAGSLAIASFPPQMFK